MIRDINHNLISQDSTDIHITSIKASITSNIIQTIIIIFITTMLSNLYLNSIQLNSIIISNHIQIITNNNPLHNMDKQGISKTVDTGTITTTITVIIYQEALPMAKDTLGIIITISNDHLFKSRRLTWRVLF